MLGRIGPGCRPPPLSCRPLRLSAVPAPQAPAQPTDRWLRRLALALPLAALLVMAVYLQRMVAAHDALQAHTLEQAGGRAQQLAAAKAQQVEALLVGADLALRQFRDQVLVGNPEGMAAAARAIVAAMPAGAIGHFSVSDADGRVVYPSAHMQGEGDLPLNVADRGYFRQLAASPADLLTVHPAMVSRVTGQWAVPVTRPLLRDGRFAGVVLLSLSPSYLSDALARQQPSGQDVISLFHADGSYLARSTDIDHLLGTQVPASRPFLQPGAASEGRFRLVAQADGRERLYAWYRLDRLPLIVNVGLDIETVLAPSRAEGQRAQQRVIVLAPLSLALVLAMSWLLLRICPRTGRAGCQPGPDAGHAGRHRRRPDGGRQPGPGAACQPQPAPVVGPCPTGWARAARTPRCWTWAPASCRTRPPSRPCARRWKPAATWPC